MHSDSGHPGEIEIASEIAPSETRMKPERRDITIELNKIHDYWVTPTIHPIIYRNSFFETFGNKMFVSSSLLS